MGAALATIASFVAALEHPDVQVNYFGFGSPRVGNKHFVDAFKKTVLDSKGTAHHFANEHDIVTGIPGAVFFCHVPGGIMLREVRSPGCLPRLTRPDELPVWFRRAPLPHVC